MDQIRIIQQNVLSWGNKKYELTNIYRSVNPLIIVINSHGIKDDVNLKIAGYNAYSKNMYNEYHDGIAILIKQNIKHKIKDDFMTNTLEIVIVTAIGQISIATTYLPPRSPFLPLPDFHQLAYNNHPTYIIGDLTPHIHYLVTRRTI